MAAEADRWFDLRVRTTCSGGRLTPRAAVVQATRAGLAGLALADVGTLAGLAEAWAAAVELGVRLIPAVELVTTHARYVAYCVDPGAPALRRLLARGAHGEPVTPAMALYAVQRAGGVAVQVGGSRAAGGEERDWHRASLATVARLEREAGQPGLVERLHQRMTWRWHNLTAAEFRDSFAPTPVPIRTLRLGELLARPGSAVAPRSRGPGRPFVLVRPAAAGREDEIAAWLARRGLRVRGVTRVTRFADLAWDLLRRDEGPGPAALRTLLMLEADQRRHGARHQLGGVIQLEDWAGHDPRLLKRALRRDLGTIRFERVQYRAVAETCFDSFVHLPDPDAAAREQAILTRHGVDRR